MNLGLGLALELQTMGLTPYQKLLKSATWAIDFSRPQGVKETDVASMNTRQINPILDVANPKLIGVMWNKQSSPTMQKTYTGDFMLQFPYNQITEVTDSLGNVFVKIPKFYIAKQDGNGNKGIFLSDRPIEGGYLPECFKNHATGKELAYVLIGKYLGSLSDDTTKLESKPNKFPANSLNIVQFRELAEANGVGYQQQDIHGVDIINQLFYVAFGTLNAQAIMQGYTAGQYSASHTAVVAGTGVNQIVIANAFADQYRVGQAISIGTTLGAQNVMTNRLITAINVYDASNKAIVFDGAAVNIAIGNIVYNVGYKTGWSSEIQTGWAVANDGKSPCAFLGIESIFGDIFQFVDGININERQSWVCKNAESYASNLFAAPYEQIGYVNASVDGYASEMGFDANLPFAEITKTVTGGSSTTFYSDYYYQSTGQRVALFGGGWNVGSGAGLSYWYLGNSSSLAGLTFGARLLRKPIDDPSAQMEVNTSVLDLGANVLIQQASWTTSDGFATAVAKGVGDEIAYTNLVTNGDFSQGTTGWVGNARLENGKLVCDSRFNHQDQDIIATIGDRVYLGVGEVTGDYAITLFDYNSYSNGISTTVNKGVIKTLTTNGVRAMLGFYTSGGGQSTYDNAIVVKLNNNPAVQLLESKLGRQLTVAECDYLFAFTPTSATVKAKAVVGFQPDALNTYGSLPSNAPNPTSGDFAFARTIKTAPTLVTQYFGTRAEQSEATCQYGFKLTNTGVLSLILEGTLIQIATGIAINTWYDIVVSRISGTLKVLLNGAQVVNQAHAVTLTSRPNVREFALSTNVGGTTHTGFANVFTAIVGYTDTDEAKFVTNWRKYVTSNFGF